MSIQGTQKIIIVGEEESLSHVYRIKAPGIYPYGEWLPERMAKLTRWSAISLAQAIFKIKRLGGTLFISDMYRSREEQWKAHHDWKTGQKTAYSPPPGYSVHEAARAIDIDTGNTGIGYIETRRILEQNGWMPISNEPWHFERRGTWQKTMDEYGYKSMVRGMLAMIGNLGGGIGDDPAEILTAQKKLGITKDSIYGPETYDAIRKFQKKEGLREDGLLGPITKMALF